MLKRFSLLLALLVAMGSVFSPLDCRAEETTSAGIDLYFSSMESLQAGKTDDALKGLKKAMRIFDKNHFQKGVLVAHLSMAQLYCRRGEYDKAVGELEQARQNAQQQMDVRNQGLVSLRLGIIERRRSKFEEAAAAYEKALESFRTVEDEEPAAAVRIRMAEILVLRGEYDKAAKVLDTALEVVTKRENHSDAALALSLQARIHAARSDYAAASKYFDKALTLARKARLAAEEQMISMEKAAALADQGTPGQGEELLKNAMDYFGKTADRRNSGLARAELAESLLVQDKLEEAKTMISQASQDMKKAGGDHDRGVIMLVEGRILARTGDLADAEDELEEALETFVKVKTPREEMLARLALSQVQTDRGRLMASGKNAELALALAGRLGSRKGEAQGLYLQGLARQAAREDVAAIPLFDKAYAVNQGLKDETGEFECLVNKAESLVRLGFLEDARANRELAGKIPGVAKRPSSRADLLILRGFMAYAAGKDSAAGEEYKKARAICEKLGDRGKRARLLEALAELEASSLNLAQASMLWDQARRIYDDISSPGGSLRCRTAMVDLALDEDRASEAEAIVPRSLRLSRQRPSEMADLVVDGSRRRYGRLAQYGPRTGIFDWRRGTRGAQPQWEESDTDTRPRRRKRQAAGQDEDGAILNCLLDGLRARMALAAGRPEAAEKTLVAARETATKFKNERALNELNLYLCEVYLVEGKYEQALRTLESSNRKDGLCYVRAAASTAVAKSKLGDARSLLKKACQDLIAREMREGLWRVPPRVMRAREGLYRDYVNALMTSASEKGAPSGDQDAWRAVQSLKMRRILYDLSAVGADKFLGITDDELNRQRSLQFAFRNEEKRRRHPSLAKAGRSTAAQTAKDAPAGQEAPIDSFWGDLEKSRPELVRFMRGEPPSVDAIQGLLADGEVYASLTFAGDKCRLLMVGKKAFKAATAKDSPQDILRWTRAALRGIEKPYYYGVGDELSDLWVHLFGDLVGEASAAKTLIVEPDSFLVGFPFEILVPGEASRSYPDRQAAPMLMDQTLVLRSTSAFRFVRQRTAAGKAKPRSLPALGRPIPPPVASASTDSQSVKLLLKTWKQAMDQFKSSDANPDAGRVAAYAAIFGPNGSFIEAAKATRSAFLNRDPKKHSMTYLGSPALLPGTPAGKIRGPFLLFTAVDKDPGSGFCGVGDLVADVRSGELATLTWLSSTNTGNDRSLLLLVESLGLMGIRNVLLPLWAPDRALSAETDRFMTVFYTSLKDGAALPEALKKARVELAPSGSKKNRCSPARLVLF